MIVVMEIVVCIILLFLGIAVLVTIHVFIVGRAFRRGNEAVDNSMGVHQRGGHNRRSPSMSQDEIMELPCFDYRVDETEKSSSISMECAVCLENFSVGEVCRLLPNCKHSFHAHCIDSWLLKTAVCPVCRRDANKIGENSSEIGLGIV